MSIRKAISVFLSFLVLFFTILSVLSIWDIIEIKHVLTKTLTTLLVLFVSTAILLFIFAVLYKGGEDKSDTQQKN
ncbi:MAG: hypothetical protein HND27_07670 [Bacteroidetes bacterium]|nr:hypothetical protein [Bacteroidota bacterium]MBV6460857.1 hypothetical protein [Flavobacteriales bacterium]WKZ75856.1 MAG: hypothetical protein QY303_02955 [Vicingaceae bacterium]MCL4816597.1 hypothetical protein [Flavobacteriales bacterium]NOG95642.1 hypothetical protein [Bacteroidota bacterium]